MSRIKVEKPITVPFSLEFGTYLKRKRIEAGLSQTDISEKLGYSSSQMVSKWERGLCGPKFKDLVKITELLNIESDEILEILKQEQLKLFIKHLNVKKES